jgi:hypothetical protein
MGWHMLTDAIEFVGRVRVTNQEMGVGMHELESDSVRPEELGVILGEEEYGIGVMVTSLDVGDGVYVTVDRLGRG